MREIGFSGQVTTENSPNFFSSGEQYAVGSSLVGYWQHFALSYERTKRDCAADGTDDYLLCYVSEGDAEVKQQGRNLTVRQGDCYWLNMAEPSVLKGFSELRLKTLSFDSNQISQWLGNPGDMTALSLAKMSNWGGALAAVMAAITPDSIERINAMPQILTEHIGCLVGLTGGLPY